MARPRSDDYDDKRQRILEESAHLFAETGFSEASISMIASACGISKALIYHYYKDKNEILFDMLKEHTLYLESVVSAIIESGKPDEEKFRALVAALMGVYVNTRDKHIVLMNELGSLDEAQQKYLVRHQNKIIHDLSKLVASLHGVDALKTPETRTAVGMVLLGSLNWTYTWFRDNGPLNHQQMATLMSEMFLTGLRGLQADHIEGLAP